MKLDRTTKHLVSEGDYLRSGATLYRVRTILRYKSGGLAFTITDTKDERTIYGYPSSELYGAEIIKETEEI